MLQLISVDSRHFTQTPVLIEKDHGQMLVKSAQHSFALDPKLQVIAAQMS